MIIIKITYRWSYDHCLQHHAILKIQRSSPY